VSGGMGAPVIVSDQVFPGKVGVAFSATPAIQDAINNPVDSWQVAGLPLCASFNNVTGQITGTPNLKGGSAITITATGAGGVSAAAPASIMISEGQPVLEAGQFFIGVVGASIYGLVQSADLTNRPISTWSAVGLPPGVQINSQGVLAGIPEVYGEYSFTITATGPGGVSSAGATVKIFDGVGLKPRIWERQTVFVYNTGQNFSYQMLASGDPDYWILNSILPAGVVFDAKKGVLSGAGLLPGVWELQFFAKNQFGESDPLFLTFAFFQNTGAYYHKIARINPANWSVSFDDPVAASTTAPITPAASSSIRHGDLVTFRISFERPGGSPVYDGPALSGGVISGKFSLKGLDTESPFIVTKNSDFYSILNLSGQVEYYINVDFGSPSLLSFLGDYESDSGTKANCLCEFEFILPRDPSVGGGINKITTLPFYVSVFRDTI